MILSEINIYPIKSLSGVATETAVVEDRGLTFDRRWMLVDEARTFISQRESPLMAAIRTEIGPRSLTIWLGNYSFDVAFEPPFEPPDDRFINVKVWSSTVRAQSYGAEINERLSEFIGTRCRLVRMADDAKRSLNPFFAVRRYQDTVSFADGYPFLLIGQASLDDLNSRLAEPVPMNRFRPNLVVQGSEAFAEDTWKKIRVGDTVFHVVKPCARCVITTIDQTTGEKKGKEPLATLSKYRTRKGKVLFGQNLIADEAGGQIGVGDSVEVIEALRLSS